ncbi:MAG: hydrolase [Coprococcus sp.]|nr:hydrolase [Coprococcus sp.]
MRKFGKVLLVSLLASSLAATPVLAAPSISDLENSKAEAENEAEALRQELQTLIEKLNQLESDLVQKGQDISQAENDLAAAQEREQQQYEDMKLRIKYMYEEGDSSFVEALLNAENFSDLLNKAQYMQSVHTYDREMLQEYVETKQKIADLKATLETQMADMQTMQTEYKNEETNLNDTLTAKQEEIADLDVQLQAAAEAAAKAKAEQEERERQAAMAQNPSSSDEEGTGGAGSSDSDDNPGTGGGSGSNDDYQAGGDSSVGNAIVSAASGYLGVMYEWGGASYSGVDCSGLVMLAHRAVGISLSHNSGSIGGGGRAVSAAEALPGDVVCYSGHVGIYVGGGMMIHAPEPGKAVTYASVNYAPHWFRRYW